MLLTKILLPTFDVKALEPCHLALSILPFLKLLRNSEAIFGPRPFFENSKIWILVEFWEVITCTMPNVPKNVPKSSCRRLKMDKNEYFTFLGMGPRAAP